jgi:hypothetical protein
MMSLRTSKLLHGITPMKETISEQLPRLLEPVRLVSFGELGEFHPTAVDILFYHIKMQPHLRAIGRLHSVGIGNCGDPQKNETSLKLLSSTPTSLHFEQIRRMQHVVILLLNTCRTPC